MKLLAKRSITTVLAAMLLISACAVGMAAATPQKPQPGISIACGGEHNLAILNDGSLWSWGLNRFGQLGMGAGSGSLVPVKVLDDAVVVSSSFGHVLAVKRDGSLWAWGWNAWGQLGDGTKDNRLSPVQVMSGGVVDAVAANYVYAGTSQTGDTTDRYYSYSLALKADGSLWTWGTNSFGQLGDGTYSERPLPQKIMDGVVAIDANGGSSFAVKADGSLWSWGRNSFGELGNGAYTDSNVPVKIMDGAVEVTAGLDHAFAVKTDGSLWGWGRNQFGQLGNGAYKDSPFPTVATGVTGVTDVSAGGDHTFALKANGELWAWGSNGNGQIGDGTAKTKYTPVKVADGVAMISASGDRSMMVKNDGTLYAWGWNVNDAQGQGASGNTRLSPLEIMKGAMLPGSQPPIRAFEGASDWAIASLSGLSSSSMVPPGLMSNYKKNITRAEFAALMVSIYERRVRPIQAGLCPFDDIKGNAYENDIIKANTIHLVSGMTETKFMPDAPLTREQAAKIIAETVASTSTGKVTEATGPLQFQDAANVGAWAVKYVEYVNKLGIMTGDNFGRFLPRDNLTREQAMVMAYRASLIKFN